MQKMTFDEAVAYIDSTPKFTTKNSLDHTKAFLKALGQPDAGMKILHVAGTNGKGSVCAYLSSILTAAGKRTGLFTSPHLVVINERFQIDQEMITDDVFLDAFHRVMETVEDMKEQGYAHPTYFELLFLIGMIIFKDAGVEYLVLETGLGGRLDATNSVEHPLACIITSISLDHTEYLGNTVAEIAGEKAGIIKPGVPVIYDATVPEVKEVIEAQAARLSSPAYGVHPSMYEILEETDKYIDFSISTGYYNYEKVRISSVAEYQVMNASEAITALRVFGEKDEFSEDLIRLGLSNMKWQGRMETVLPGVILDGGHNEAGVAEFVRTAKRLEKDYEVTLLFSAVSDKDYEHMIRTICSELKISRVVVTEVGGYRSVDTKQLADHFRRFSDLEILEKPVLKEAFETALELKGDGILFCVGSLYLVGGIKALI